VSSAQATQCGKYEGGAAEARLALVNVTVQNGAVDDMRRGMNVARSRLGEFSAWRLSKSKQKEMDQREKSDVDGSERCSGIDVRSSEW